jgi:ATP-dependent DNA ligase
MLCYPFEEKRLAKWPTPWLVQPKLDGERCRILWNADGVVSLRSSEDNEIISVPHLIQELTSWSLMSVELDGELYIHGMPFENIHSVVGRTVNLHQDHEKMQLHLFDMVSREMQFDRLDRLHSCKELFSLNQSSMVQIVHFDLVSRMDDLMAVFGSYKEDGYEGIVVRHPTAAYLRRRSTSIMKFKPKKEDIYQIVGWKEEISIEGRPKGRLGALVCESDGERFSVGTGLTDESREVLWAYRKSLPGLLARIAYQHITTGKNVPRFPVLVEVINRQMKSLATGHGLMTGKERSLNEDSPKG